MQVDKRGLPQSIARAPLPEVTIASAAPAATTRAGRFRRARMGAELITGPGAWYGAVVAAPLVLGSASPRRREILSRLGLPHVVVAPSADETVLEGEGVVPYLARVVELKLDAVRRALPPELAARTPVVSSWRTPRSSSEATSSASPRTRPRGSR